MMLPSFNGGLLIDKPEGLTSHDVVARLRYILRSKRIGHTGTLDPFATGLMLMCIGTCTRLSQFLTSKEKSYDATIRFGFATDTQDYTGRPLSESNSTESVTEERLREVMKDFIGLQNQTPPMFSAKKVEGVALHRLARQGQVIFRASVPVTIHSLELLPLNTGTFFSTNPDGTLDAQFSVTCSAGTYIRTLAHDLGQQLGCGAHLKALRRTRIGNFSIDQAISIEYLAGLAAAGMVTDYLIKPIEFLYDWPRIHVLAEDQLRFRYGQPIQVHLSENVTFPNNTDSFLAVCDHAEELLGIARFDAPAGVARPQVVFSE